jgi:Na+:H+ antiporter, NhaA family
MRTIIKKLMSPIIYFIKDSRAVGIVLIICTLTSLILTNSFFGETYRGFWERSFYSVPNTGVPQSFLDWINNFLMAFFFVMMGTEIKKELIEGELATFKKAVLPFGAAIGGMLIPALIFFILNRGTSHSNGWGIPMATDIAFALGVASLLGKRVPLILKIFLMVLAIIDDLGAIVVIAFFYGGQISWLFLSAASVIYALLLALLYTKVKFGALQILLGLILWYTIYNSGIEGSISGVLFAFSIPIKKLASVEKYIHNVVSFIILPLFALANTAILIPDNFAEVFKTSVSMGVIIGLVVGKPVGIYLVSRILVFFNLAHLPENVNWKNIFGVGMLAGIGFTMSIFITMLAYTDDQTRDISKISILTAATVSVILSIIYFQFINVKALNHSENV